MISKRIYDKINYTLLLIAFIGISTTKIALSWCTVLFIINFVLGEGLISRIKTVWSLPLNRWIILFFGLNIIGLTWTSDITAGLKLVKGYLPLLILPLIASTTSFTTNQTKTFLKGFLAGLVFTSIYNFLYINQVFGSIKIQDFREMSRFGSHIRYAILVVAGIMVCIESIRNKQIKIFSNKLSILLIIWFTFYTLYSQILSGVACLISLTLFYFFLLIWMTKKRWIVYLTLSLVLIGSLGFYTQLFPNKPITDLKKLPTHTATGNTYIHKSSPVSEINGLPIYYYFQEYELLEAWNKRSRINYFEYDLKNHPIRMTIARYMTALQLPKDYEGVAKLSEEDIANIENGKVYPKENKDLLWTRIYSLKYELMNNADPNGKSLLQRIEHWKASIIIIRTNPLFGVGTGGNQNAFNDTYKKMDSLLTPSNQLRSHNMFFAIQIGLGCIGTLLFSILLGTVLYDSFKLKNGIVLAAYIILITSFLIEDTIETQVGVYFMSLFMIPLIQKQIALKLKN